MMDTPTAKQCPYCGITFSLEGVDADHAIIRFQSTHGMLFGGEAKKAPSFTVTSHLCPSCGQGVMWLNELERDEDALTNKIIQTSLLWPKVAAYSVAREIPQTYSAALTEAASILQLSPKASAALSRRALQQLLRDRGGISPSTLFKEIEAIIATGILPPYLARDIDAIRRIGNVATHPAKDANPAEVVDVDPEEAKWTLSVLDALLQFFFVDEAKSQRRWATLNQKFGAKSRGK
jgi:predicted RNA-binding Zn-ribbon protein involved in translation (DUF1610 family)